MKAAFGLIGVLGVLAAIIWIMSAQLDHTATVLDTGREAKEDTAQVTGRGFGESYSAEPVERGGKLYALRITSVMAGEPAEQIFGLRQGDEIIQIGPQRVRDMMGDVDMANALLLDASRGGQTIVIMRDGGEVTIDPRNRSRSAPAATPTGPAGTLDTLRSGGLPGSTQGGQIPSH